MQRWLCDTFSEDASAPETLINHTESQEISIEQPNSNAGRLHTFRVLVNQHMEPNERVAITGECSTLGRWLPAKCVQLNRENGE